MNEIPFDILDIILKKLSLIDKLNLLSVNKNINSSEYVFYSNNKYVTKYRIIIPRCIDISEIQKKYISYYKVVNYHTSSKYILTVNIPQLHVIYDSVGEFNSILKNLYYYENIRSLEIYGIEKLEINLDYLKCLEFLIVNNSNIRLNNISNSVNEIKIIGNSTYYFQENIYLSNISLFLEMNYLFDENLFSRFKDIHYNINFINENKQFISPKINFCFIYGNLDDCKINVYTNYHFVIVFENVNLSSYLEIETNYREGNITIKNCNISAMQICATDFWSKNNIQIFIMDSTINENLCTIKCDIVSIKNSKILEFESSWCNDITFDNSECKFIIPEISCEYGGLYNYCENLKIKNSIIDLSGASNKCDKISYIE